MKLILRKPWHYSQNARLLEMGKEPYRRPKFEEVSEEWFAEAALELPATAPSTPPK